MVIGCSASKLLRTGWEPLTCAGAMVVGDTKPESRRWRRPTVSENRSSVVDAFWPFHNPYGLTLGSTWIQKCCSIHRSILEAMLIRHLTSSYSPLVGPPRLQATRFIGQALMYRKQHTPAPPSTCYNRQVYSRSSWTCPPSTETCMNK